MVACLGKKLILRCIDETGAKIKTPCIVHNSQANRIQILRVSVIQIFVPYIDGLVHERRNSIANAFLALTHRYGP